MQPITLHVDLQTRCNVRCKQCHIWRTRTTDPIDVKYIHQALFDFARYCHKNNSRGIVSLVGGEVFLDKNRTLGVLDTASRLGLHSVVVSNGTLINSQLANDLMSVRCRDINISIDGLESIHDELRGVPGTFQRAISAVKNIQSANSFKKMTRVHIATTAMKKNMHQLHEVADLAYRLQTDSWSLQMYSSEFGSNSGVVDTSDLWYDDSELEIGKAELSRQLQHVSKYGSFWQQNNQRTISRFLDYMDVKQSCDARNTCTSHESNIFIDPYGEVMLCLFSPKVFPSNRLGNISSTSLDAILNSSDIQDLKSSINLCKKKCNVLNCHWR